MTDGVALPATGGEALRAALDAADAALMLFDADDRLVYASRKLLQLYGAAAEAIRPGRSFTDIVEEVVNSGALAVAAQDRSNWLADRMRLHREGGSTVRHMSDGSWRRIVEQRLPDGGYLSWSTDISDLVAREAELTLAREAAQSASARLHEVLDALPAGLALFDGNDRLVMSNRALLDIHPRIAGLLAQPGHDFEALVRANHERGGLPGMDAHMLEEHLHLRNSQRSRGLGGGRFFTGERWIEPFERRTPEGWLVGVQVDVTELVEQREAAEQAHAWLQDALALLPSGFALFDQDDKLVLCNRRFLELHGLTELDAPAGRPFEDMLRQAALAGQFPSAAGDVPSWVASVLAERRAVGEELSRLVPLRGNRWMRVVQQRTRSGGLAMTFTEVSDLVRREQALMRVNEELEAARSELQRQSLTDALTGLANRRLLDRRLALDWARCVRLRQPMAMLLIDVDHFKRFNDHHGHPAGDACLRRVARALESTVNREVDLVARYGGEEFAVVLPHTELDGATLIAQACLKAVDEAAIVHGDSPVGPMVSISIGVAAVAEPQRADRGAPSLLRAADGALMKAKAAGRHRIEVAPPR